MVHHELPSGLVWKQEGNNVHLYDDDSGYIIHITVKEFKSIAEQLMEDD
jgi:hypothetical protein